MATRSFNDLNPRQQLAVLIGVPLAVAALLIWLTSRSLAQLGPDEKLPQFLQSTKKTDSLWAQIKELEGQIVVKDQIIAERPKVEAELKSLEADIKAARERLPLESEKAEMRLLIDKLARDIPSDIGIVQVNSVRIIEAAAVGRDRSAGADDTAQVTYQADIAGDLNGLIKYVDVIEKNPRFMTVNSLSIKPGDVRVTDDKRIMKTLHTAKMSIVTYVYNPKQGQGR